MYDVVQSGGRDPLSRKVIGCAIEVHRTMGPGLLESVYEACLACEFEQHNIAFKRQVRLPLKYKGRRLGSGFRLDFIIEDRLILELKTVDQLMAIHDAQLLSYMKLSGIRTGLLLNFKTDVIRNGIKRLVL